MQTTRRLQTSLGIADIEVKLHRAQPPAELFQSRLGSCFRKAAFHLKRLAIQAFFLVCHPDKFPSTELIDGQTSLSATILDTLGREA